MCLCDCHRLSPWCTMCAQPGRDEVPLQHERVVQQPSVRFSPAAEPLAEAKSDILGFCVFAKARWQQTRSNNPLQCLNKEILRSIDVVGIF
jgi:transposase-like protein